MLKKLFITVFIVISSLILTSSANALVWTEIGDAGSSLSTAQTIFGSGAITAISGSLTAGIGDQEDIFAFYIPVGNLFSATTVGGAGWDTQLFLLDSVGMGVYANDDSVGLQSTLPAGHANSPSASGIYYLAISDYDRDPISAGGEIFPDMPFNNVFGPTGPGGSQPLSGWNGSSSPGSYTIFLTGASAVPEPASLSLLGLGLLGLLRKRKKRKK